MDDKPQPGGLMSAMRSMCQSLFERAQLMLIWCCAPRHKLDGGMIVCQGGLLAEGGFSYVYMGVEARSGRRVVRLTFSIKRDESRYRCSSRFASMRRSSTEMR